MHPLSHSSSVDVAVTQQGWGCFWAMNTAVTQQERGALQSLLLLAWTVGAEQDHQRPWSLKLFSRKVCKDGLCVRTNLHWKWEPYLQGGKNLSIKDIPPRPVSLPCVYPRTLDIPARAAQEPELVLFPSVSLSISLFLPALSPNPLPKTHCCVFIWVVRDE